MEINGNEKYESSYSMGDYFEWLQRYLEEQRILTEQYLEISEILSAHSIRWRYSDEPFSTLPEWDRLSRVHQEDERRLYDEINSMRYMEYHPSVDFAKGLPQAIQRQEQRRVRQKPHYQPFVESGFYRQGSDFFPFQKPYDMLITRDNPSFWNRPQFSNHEFVDLRTHRWLYGYTDYGGDNLPDGPIRSVSSSEKDESSDSSTDVEDPMGVYSYMYENDVRWRRWKTKKYDFLKENPSSSQE